MANGFGIWFLSLTILVLALSIPCSHSLRTKNKIKTKSAAFLSPKFELGPGLVQNKNYYNIDFPRGHIALKRFDAEVVDEAGRSVPLYETYLHHWIIMRYYIRKDLENDISQVNNQSNFRFVRNNGVCQGNTLGQYYGVGSETRKTPTFVPDPYGIEIGTPEKIPDGFEERWMVNVHAIDTRGAVDTLGCAECRCDLYNITVDEDGQPLEPDYKGGLNCCYDQTQCKVRKGFWGERRSLYLKYTVEWADWSDFILPVQIYIFDITDTWTGLKSAEHNCQNKMAHGFGGWLVSLWSLVLALSIPYSHSLRIKNGIKTKTTVFLSPKFELGPGSVENKFYYNIDFPRGHIATKRFDAEVVDEAGHSIPLHETYLHHWVLMRYHVRKDVPNVKHDASLKKNQSNFRFVRNSGVCNNLGQYYGLGSETRKTSTFVPDPYGIEVGNPAHISDGFDERWMLNVHAIDTRGAVDRLGCTECKCDLYNVTKDEYGRPLRPDYKGGLLCCYDQTQCKVREGFQGARRGLYLKYTVEWTDWSDFILPVQIYIFDITDTWTGLNSDEHHCKIEYEVAETCKGTSKTSHQCIDTRRSRVKIPNEGYLVYGVAHQHTGGIGSALYGEDGRVICSSTPIYGKGKEAGDEAGYIVGMTTCYPKPGSVEILDGETLVHESNYSSFQTHTGIMGLFYILVADKLPNPMLYMHSPL